MPIRIVVENSGYALHNFGDIAMLQVAFKRLQELWPEAEIHVLTSKPERLTCFCPTAIPLSVVGRNQWYSSCLAYRWADKMQRYDEYLRRSLPGLTYHLSRIKLHIRRRRTIDITQFWHAMNRADLVVASGGGYLTDSFPFMVEGVLSTIALATTLGKPTVLLGQGIGPLTQENLLEIAKRVLPGVSMITLRENKTGGPLLNSLSYPPERVITTGDDAIEYAYNNRSNQAGKCIGVNVRIANYSHVDTEVEQLRKVLERTSNQLSAPLIPIPISIAVQESDISAILKVLGDRFAEAADTNDFREPLDAIRQAGRCRIVVTGSYHAAVFALSQGIPAICLAKSKYYVDKFSGLAAQFGAGCEIVMLDDPALEHKLHATILQMWASASNYHSSLLKRAVDQIRAGRTAYGMLKQFVN